MHSREYLGPGSLSHLAQILDETKSKRILLVRGKESFCSSGAEEALLPYLQGMDVFSFFDFAPNPKLEDILRGVAYAKEVKPNAILAVGGGSAIDMAKLINILAAQSEDCASLITGECQILNPGNPLIAIPTTAGTGSEVTHFAVAYIDYTKYSLAHPYALPNYAIVDANLTHHMPPKLTAVTGMDALCQAIEAFWAVGATQESQLYSKHAIELILPSLKEAVRSPSPRSRNAMAMGAYYAGKAINISKTTAPHALSYALTSMLGIPHGHAVALTLGQFFLLHSFAEKRKVNVRIGYEAHSANIRALLRCLGANSAMELEQTFNSLMTEIGLETNLQRIGVSGHTQIFSLAKQVNWERLSNNPIDISEADIVSILTNLSRPIQESKERT